MLRKNLVRFSTALLSVIMLSSILTGCGTTSTQSSGKTEQTLRYNLGAEPKTIDPGITDTIEGLTVVGNTFEGLLRLDNKDNPIAGVAEKWETSKDGLTYTFHLRKNAKWSDGKTVTANDFKYGWQRALDPKTASGYAYQLYYIKNGKAFNTGTAKAEDLGIKVIDDYTLQVTLEYPTSYFLSLTSFPTYSPVRKDIAEKDQTGWCLKPETYVSNGPFKLTSWKSKDSMELVKNKNYWNSKNVKLDKLEFKLLDQPTSYLAAFQAGQLDFIDSPPAEQTPSLIKNGTAKTYPYLGTTYIALNLSPKATSIDPEVAKALSNVKVRKALNLAINRDQLVKNITKGGQKPAAAFVCSGILENKSGKDFRNKNYFKTEGDVKEAKKLLSEAGYPDGKGFPKLTYLYNTSDDNKNIAEAIQDMWRKNLGIDVDLQSQEKKVFMSTRDAKNYLTARANWIADYSDPMTFLDVYVSDGGDNITGYNNPEYDKYVKSAKLETDPAKRMALLHKAEDTLMNDMPIIPLFFSVSVCCTKSYVKNIHKSALGMTLFDNTYIQK